MNIGDRIKKVRKSLEFDPGGVRYQNWFCSEYDYWI